MLFPYLFLDRFVPHFLFVSKLILALFLPVPFPNVPNGQLFGSPVPFGQ